MWAENERRVEDDLRKNKFDANISEQCFEEMEISLETRMA